MTGAALQRFGLLLVAFGGVLDLRGAIQGNYLGLPSYGVLFVFLGLLVGLVGAALELYLWATAEGD